MAVRKYAQIRYDGNVVCLIGDESMNMPINSEVVYTINIENHEQKDIVKEGMIYNPATGTFSSGNPSYKKEYGRYGPFPTEGVFATAAEKEDSDTITLELPASAETGTLVKFSAPCDCVGIDKLKIEDTAYIITDSMGNTVAEISCDEGGVFSVGAIVAVVLDKDAGKAYIQNPAKTINETKENLQKVIKETELSGDKIKGGAVAVEHGGTGATDAEAARKNLGIDEVTPVEKGGTGGNDAETARKNLGLGAVATEDILPVSKGGTGGNDAETARKNLGLGAVATEDTVPISNGGTGATNEEDARKNIGITFGTDAPSGTATVGAVYFKIVT